jgi:hypothetical protein
VYDLGATLAFSARLYDKNPVDDATAVLVNPLTASLTITLPDGTTVLPTITVPPATTGTFTYSHPSTLAGRYVGRWFFTLTGGNTSAYVEQFDVGAADPGYLLSLASAKKHLNIGASTLTYDDEIRDWLAGITRVVEYYVGACVPRTVVDYAQEGPLIRLGTSPVMSITSITPYLTAGRTYSALEVVVSTDGRIYLLTGMPFVMGPFEITYRVGRNPIPANIAQAARIILGHLWETQRGASGLPLQGSDDSSFVPGFGYAVPNRALELLKPDSLGPAIG